MKIKLTIEYDGAPFVGWQSQTNGPSIQDAISEAVLTYLNSQAKRRGLGLYDAAPLVTGSGRTDSGVHALGQTASFVWPSEVSVDPQALAYALNGILPRSIAIREALVVDENFDARLSKHRKQYSYYFLLRRASPAFYAGRAWRVPDHLDVANMSVAARCLTGQKDFASFRAIDCVAPSTIRTLHVCELSREREDLLRLVVQGNGFLKQMIRIIAGTLVSVGKGLISSTEIQRIIDARNRAEAGPTAPPYGLVLDWVKYHPHDNSRNDILEDLQ